MYSQRKVKCKLVVKTACENEKIDGALNEVNHWLSHRMQDKKIIRMLGSYNKTQKDCECQAEMQILFEELLKVFEQEDDMILTD